ncbi:MAG: hypothetical protein DRI46_08640 [Chloroflexi bacterium]|nr:MAG: hypothetical protein DRI46_08640 [Chloroflexota bacterium]
MERSMRRGRLLRNLWADYSWFIILALGTASLVLGYIGFWKNSLALGAGRTFLDNLYLTLGLISLNSGAVPPPISWELQLARFAVPAVTAYTAFLAFTTIFIQQTERVRLWFLQDHIIICGLGKKGYRLANQFLQDGNRVVVIEVDDDNEWIENIRSAGAVVIQGDAADSELLAKTKINRASCLIGVAGDDGKNAEIAVSAEKISRDRKDGALVCIIHIFDAQLWRLLREKELHIGENTHFRLELFNIFNRGAHLMVQGNPPWAGLSPESSPHVLIVGLGKMGQRVIIEAARGWQLYQGKPDRKIDFTLVDREGGKKLALLLNQQPRLDKLASFHALDMDILSGEFDKLVDRFTQGADCQLTLAYICLDDDTFSLQTGLRLNHQLRKYQVPIVMRMGESGGLAMLIDQGAGEGNSFGDLRIFDLLDQTCTAELLQGGTHEVLARSLHQIYLENARKKDGTSSDDESLKDWEELSGELKETNRQLADRIPVMLAAAGYRIAPLTDWDAENLIFLEEDSTDEVTLMARMEHESWCQRKKAQGWRFGPEKDPDQRTNPSLVLWEELPEGEKEKNKAYIRDLPYTLARAGFQIEKT